MWLVFFYSLNHIKSYLKKKLLDLIERPFQKIFKNEGTRYLACNDKKAFFTSTDHRGYKHWSCQNVSYHIFWKIFTSDLVISYTDKLLVFRWVQIVLLL